MGQVPRNNYRSVSASPFARIGGPCAMRTLRAISRHENFKGSKFIECIWGVTKQMLHIINKYEHINEISRTWMKYF